MKEELQKAIRDSGLSMRELSKRSEVSAPTLSRFVNGERDIYLTVASKLMKALGLKVIRTKAITIPIDIRRPATCSKCSHKWQTKSAKPRCPKCHTSKVRVGKAKKRKRA